MPYQAKTSWFLIQTDAFPLVLCVTPPGLYGLMKKIGGKEPAWDEGFFDLLVVDEASMMRLPELILSGAFVRQKRSDSGGGRPSAAASDSSA